MRKSTIIIKTVLVAFTLFLCQSSDAQTVTIPNAIYRVNDVITATITKFTGTMGVENDIKRVSETKQISGNGTYQVGKATSPGQYLIKFVLGPVEKSFLIFVVPSTSIHSTPDLVKEEKKATGLTPKFMDKLVTLNSAQWKIIMGTSFPKYLANHAVSTTTTFVVCVTASAVTTVPTLWVQCGKSVAGNAKDFMLILLEEAALWMKVNGQLTQSEFNSIKISLATIDFISSLLEGFDIDKGANKIKLNGVELLSGGTTYVSELTSPGANLETAVNVSTDFAKKVDIVLKLTKK